MGGMTGKKYEAIKDYLEWHGFDVKEFTPLFVMMGEIWARNQKN